MMTVTYTARAAHAVCPYHPMESTFAWTRNGKLRIADRATLHNERFHPRSVVQLGCRA